MALKSKGKILDRVLGERLFGEMYGMVFLRNHMLFDLFDRKFKQMFNTGLISRIAKKHQLSIQPETYARFQEPTGPKILTMEHLEGGFIICFVPLWFCVAVFICEWLIKIGELLIVKLVVSAFYATKSS